MTRTIFVRTRSDPVPSIPVIRSVVQSLHPGMPYLRVESLDARLRPKLLEWEVATKLLGAFGSLAALLGAAGLYVLVAFDVSRRTKELGIRSALGARRPGLLGMIVLDGLKVCSIGTALGAGIAMPLAALLRSRLFGLGFADAPTYLAVAAGMMLIAVAASLVPAAKAAVADPAVVLRAE